MKRLMISLTIAAVLFLSCGRKTNFPPAGSYSDIVLVTETGEPGGLNDYIIRELQHPVDYYTKQEIQFKLRMISAEKVTREPPTKNMIIFGVARQGAVGSVIENFIGTNAVRKVLEGKNHIFKKMDYPTIGQLTVIVTASSPERLKKVVSNNGGAIRDIIEEANRERLREYLLGREDTEGSAELRAKYGFHINIPYIYKINQDRGDVPGIEIIRTQPHRGITISWRSWNKTSVSLADSTELYDFRSDIAWKMYDKDVMRKDLVFYSEDELGQYNTIRMDGYWENSEDLFGGPFICYFILDRGRSKLWMIDCLVYAPGFSKHKMLRELRAVAETFRIN